MRKGDGEVNNTVGTSSTYLHYHHIHHHITLHFPLLSSFLLPSPHLLYHHYHCLYHLMLVTSPLLYRPLAITTTTTAAAAITLPAGKTQAGLRDYWS